MKLYPSFLSLPASRQTIFKHFICKPQHGVCRNARKETRSAAIECITKRTGKKTTLLNDFRHLTSLLTRHAFPLMTHTLLPISHTLLLTWRTLTICLSLRHDLKYHHLLNCVKLYCKDGSLDEQLHSGHIDTNLHTDEGNNVHNMNDDTV